MTALPHPQRWACTGGWLYLAIIGLGLFGEAGVRSALVVSGDAAATVARTAASQTFWRTSIVGDLLMHLLDVPVFRRSPCCCRRCSALPQGPDAGLDGGAVAV